MGFSNVGVLPSQTTVIETCLWGLVQIRLLPAEEARGFSSAQPCSTTCVISGSENKVKRQSSAFRKHCTGSSIQSFSFISSSAFQERPLEIKKKILKFQNDVQSGSLSNKSTKKNKTSREVSFFPGLTQRSISVAMPLYASPRQGIQGKGGGCREQGKLRD